MGIEKSVINSTVGESKQNEVINGYHNLFSVFLRERNKEEKGYPINEVNIFLLRYPICQSNTTLLTNPKSFTKIKDMKKLLTILCLVFLVSCSPSPEVPYEVPSHRLVKNGGMTYEIGSNDPFTGTSTEYQENGQPKEKIFYKNGREVSKTIFQYYENGQLGYKGNYKDGKEDGLSEGFYENGQLGYRWNHKDGKRDGLSEEFYDNGQLLSRGNYKNGKKIGDWNSYKKNGEDISNGLWERFYDNGQLMMRGNLKDGKEDGRWIFFDRDGNLTETSVFKDGERVLKE